MFFNTQVPTHAAISLSLGHAVQQLEQDINKAPKSLSDKLEELFEEAAEGKTNKDKAKIRKNIMRKIHHDMDAKFEEHKNWFRDALSEKMFIKHGQYGRTTSRMLLLTALWETPGKFAFVKEQI